MEWLTAERFRQESKKGAEEVKAKKPSQQLCHRVPNRILARAYNLAVDNKDANAGRDLLWFAYSKPNIAHSEKNEIHSKQEREFEKDAPTTQDIWNAWADRIKTALTKLMRCETASSKTKESLLYYIFAAFVSFDTGHSSDYSQLVANLPRMWKCKDKKDHYWPPAARDMRAVAEMRVQVTVEMDQAFLNMKLRHT